MDADVGLCSDDQGPLQTRNCSATSLSSSEKAAEQGTGCIDPEYDLLKRFNNVIGLVCGY